MCVTSPDHPWVRARVAAARRAEHERATAQPIDAPPEPRPDGELTATPG